MTPVARGAGLRLVALLGAVAALSLMLSSCGGSSGDSGASETSDASERAAAADTSMPGDSTGPTATHAPAVLKVRLGEIRSAVSLVEERLGGAVRLSEVNATQTEVNVFVVTSGQDHAYVVRDGVISEDTDLGAYSGKVFSAKDLAFVPGVLDKVLSTITDSEVVAFSVTPNETSGVDYIATVTAPNGEFRVLLGADGSIIATS